MTLFVLIAVIAGAILVVSVVFDGILDAFNLDIADGFLSMTSLSGAAAMFGLTGIFAESSLGTSRTIAMVAGAVTAIITLVIVGAIVRYLKKPEPEVSVSIIGAIGRVTTPALAEGYGEVSVMLNGHRLKLTARSEKPLVMGQEIEVIESLSATSVRVRPTT